MASCSSPRGRTAGSGCWCRRTKRGTENSEPGRTAKMVTLESRPMRVLTLPLMIVLMQMLCMCCTAAQANPDLHREFPGFRIAGNLYYVSTADLAVYLVTTPQ